MVAVLPRAVLRVRPSYKPSSQFKFKLVSLFFAPDVEEQEFNQLS